MARPWQNAIETPCNILRRMADWRFAKAATWAELQAVLDGFPHDYSEQAHFAHRERPDGRRSPAAVLRWVRGAWCEAGDLDRLFRVCYGRRVDADGCARFRCWRVYGERGPMRRRVVVWLADDVLTLECGEETLAQYRVRSAPDGRHFREVREPRLFDTSCRSPQLAFWELGDAAWRKAVPTPPAAPRHRRFPNDQPSLPLGDVADG